MEEIDDVQIGKSPSRGPSGRVRRAGLLFAVLLAVAATLAVTVGDGSRAWGYAGAFAVTVAIGAGVFAQANRRDRGSTARIGET